ncbi:MAG: carboxypeptidase-like regulatory domain-containing protein [Acidobacteriota bacterium]
MRHLVFLVALLCAALVPALRADPPMAKLRIEVKNLSDKPVDRASVVVRFVEGRSVVKFGKQVVTNWETRTNQEGVARIPSIPQGKVRVQVIAKGYQTFGQVFDVNEEEKTIAIKLNPPQPQFSAHD